MQLPDFIADLPEIDAPFPSSQVKTHALRSDKGLIVIFEVLQDMEVPPHSHGAQWGTVFDGKIELTMNGETRGYGPGDCYDIPAGVVHGAKLRAGTKLIDFFEEPDRYKLK